MGRKTVALSFDEEVYKQYQNFCAKNHVILSRKIESIMKKELNEQNE